MNRRNYGDSLVNLVGLQKQLLPKNPATPALVGCQSWEVQEVDDFANFNDETIEAIEEAERICKDPNRKRFSSSKELREAFGI